MFNAEMSPTEVLENALKIHELCQIYGLSAADARLMTYLHFHASQPGHFEKAGVTSRRALRLMLGHDVSRPSELDNAPTEMEQSFHEIVTEIQEGVSALDAMAGSQLGQPGRVSAELLDRLRLYEDAAFRARKIHLYHELIRPALAESEAA